MTSSRSISSLDSAVVAQNEEFLIQWLKDEYPSMDLTVGNVLREIMIRPAAMQHTLDQTDLEELRRSNSLININEDPSLANDDAVDGILSNFNITRDTGSLTTGNLTIILAANVSTLVASGVTFTANNNNFLTEQSYTGVTSSALVVNDTDRLITARDDGTYGFTIPVVADTNTSSNVIKKGTRFTTTTLSTNIVDIVAANDFSTGTDRETNEDLINKASQGFTASVLSGRVHITKLVNDVLEKVTPMSIIGFGDEEMLRDQHNIFGISQGGKADILLKTSATIETKVFTIEATLTSKDDKLWTMSITRDIYPGFYYLDSINVPSSTATGSLEIDETTYFISQPTTGFAPEIAEVYEGRFTAYQAATVTFIDTVTDHTSLSNGDTAEYTVALAGIPNIGTVQDYVVGRGVRNPVADYLAKAAIPYEVSVSLEIHYKGEEPSTATLKNAISTRINDLAFSTDRLPASVIVDVCHNYLGDSGYVVTPIDMRAYLYKPDGTRQYLRSGNAILIETDDTQGISPRTACFYTNPEAIEITLVEDPELLI